ncbi:unnamed protein product [Ilex paraguariensis]|uniref:Uncharacterized protein n=1 Tax=Ilex paraguariensis TaxID=185542 RepID=A0ABC8S7K4_9AQUA
MKKKDSDSQPLGFCHRLLNFIMNSLLVQGLKRITAGPPASHDGSMEVLLEGSSSNGDQTLKPTNSTGKETVIRPARARPEDHLSSEITVEFRHTNGSETWAPADHNLDSSGKTPNKDGSTVISDQTPLQKSVEERKREKGKDPLVLQGMEPPANTIGFGGRDPKKTVITIKDGEDERKENNIATEKGTNTKPRRPIQSLISNINEKSDAFIRRKREDMKKSYSFDPRES